jgi:replicative DNA helicase
MQGTALAHRESNGLPNSSESEAAILGAIILNNNLARDAIDQLGLDDFYIPSYRRIFSVIGALQKRGSEINSVLIGEELKKEGALESVGGISSIANLTYGLPHSTNIAHYAANLKDSAARRRGMHIGAGLIERAKDLGTPWTESVDWTRHQTADLDVAKESSLLQSWGELRALHLPEGDQIIHELERAEFGLLNAVTNVGKSTLIRNLILSLACGRPFANIATWRKPRRVVLLDFESRLRRLRKDTDKMLQSFSQDERTLVDENLQLVCDRLVNDEPLSLSNEEHIARLSREIRAWRADLVIVDTITAAFNVKDENSNSEVAKVILKPLIRMARETQAAILAAHHVGKGGSEEGRVQERAYRGRGASAFGTFPSLVLDLVPDFTDRQRVTLSLAKCKGRKFDDFNLQLDKETRWFTITDHPVIAARTSHDLVLGVLEDGKLRKRAEVDEILKGQVATSTITQCLKRAVEQGKITQPRRGEYRVVSELLPLPPPIETCQT